MLGSLPRLVTDERYLRAYLTPGHTEQPWLDEADDDDDATGPRDYDTPQPQNTLLPLSQDLVLAVVTDDALVDSRLLALRRCRGDASFPDDEDYLDAPYYIDFREWGWEASIIAHVDDAHPFPHGLRVDEAVVLCDAIAKHTGDRRLGATAVILLLGFVAIDEHAAWNAAQKALKTAWNLLGFSNPPTPICDLRDEAVTWDRLADGSLVPTQAENRHTLYSLRAAGRSEFPFEILDEMLVSAAASA
ncbi:MAG: hypothetical protein AAF721_35765 [Myxococcota bacterium]